MEIWAGWPMAALVGGLDTNKLVIIVLSVLVLLVGFLLVRTLMLKERTEQAAAKIVSMSEEVMSLSSLPISRNEVAGYKLDEKMYEGIGSITYRGRDKNDEPCDIKVPTTAALEDKMTMARLEREAKVLEGIDSEFVVRFKAFEKVKDRGRTVPLLVTEPLEGEDLSDVIKRDAPMPASRVASVMADIAAALAHVHRNEVVHRNIKPASIKINKAGHAVLHNFGVAQAEDTQQLTQRGDVLGTGLYMAPEQIMGKTLDGRSDLYSLGVVAFEMLTGKPPHAGVTFADLVMKKMTEAAPHPGVVVGGVPLEFDDLIARLMEKDPGKRPTGAGSVITELQAMQASLSRDESSQVG